MKRRICTLFFLFSGILFQNAMAQKGDMAVHLDLGYGFPSGAESIRNYQNSTYSQSAFSLGAGTNIALAGSYMLSDHLGVGIDLNEMTGRSFNQVEEYINNFTQTSTATLSGNLFAATPELILSANADKINFYGKFGVVVGLPSVTIKTTWSGQFVQKGTNIDLYTGGVAIGAYAAFGAQYPIGDHFKLSAEIFDRDLTYRPATYKNTQAFDGTSKAADQTLTNSSVSQSNLTTPMAFGSIGLKIGISYSLKN